MSFLLVATALVIALNVVVIGGGYLLYRKEMRDAKKATDEI